MHGKDETLLLQKHNTARFFVENRQIALVLLIMVEHSTMSFHPDLRLGLVWTVAALTAMSGAYYLAIGLSMFPENGQARH